METMVYKLYTTDPTDFLFLCAVNFIHYGSLSLSP